MATGASTAELAIILVDARKGILPQTLRHSFIVSMVGVRHVVLAVNKMDLVGFDQEIYDGIVASYRESVASLGFRAIVPIPLCAREGDNIASRSPRTPWYRGADLLDHLETVSIDSFSNSNVKFHLPVQWVNRPSPDFRGYAGTISSGAVSVGDHVDVLPSGRRTAVARIVTADGDLAHASAGQAVTLTLADDVDVSRGDVIVTETTSLQPCKALTARLLWMADQVLRPGQSFIMKLGTAEVNADVVALRHAVDIHSFHDHPAEALAMNGIGVVDLAFDKAIIATAYATDRELGSLILIDRMTNQTVALGIVQDELSKFENRTGQPAAAKRTVLRLVGPAGSPQRWRFWTRAARKTIEACVLWLVVAALARNGWLAFAVAFADLLLRPVADRVAAWGWDRLFAGHSHSYSSGHAD